MNEIKGPGTSLAISTTASIALIGFFGGVISGMFGVGGGIILVPAMVFLMKMNITKAIGTSLVIIVPTALIGAFKHHRLQNIEWSMVYALVPTALLGGYIGAWLTTQIPALNLKRAFGGFLILVGLRLLVFKS